MSTTEEGRHTPVPSVQQHVVMPLYHIVIIVSNSIHSLLIECSKEQLKIYNIYNIYNIYRIYTIEYIHAAETHVVGPEHAVGGAG